MISKEKYDALFLDFIERGARITELENELCLSRGGQKLPLLCPSGEEHAWDSQCRKCEMRVSYNPEATIGSKAGNEEAKTT